MKLPENLKTMMSFLKIKPFERERKQIYIWCARSTIETAENLARELKVEYGTSPPNPKKHNIVIGWGTTDLKEKSLEFPLKDFKFINSYQEIQNNRDKYRSVEIMDSKGVRVPKFCKADVMLDRLREQKFRFPLIARRNKHQEGNGLIMCLCFADVKRALDKKYDYFVEYVPNDIEFRIHIFDGKVIRISKKEERMYPENYWIKNNKRGWHFKDINIETIEEWDKSIITECKKAVKSMDMVFGAVDVIYSDFNIPYVIEINSAPALNKLGLKRYGEEFKEYINKNFEKK